MLCLKMMSLLIYRFLLSVIRKAKLYYLPIYARDLRNKMVYGLSAPVFAECIYIKPSDCNKVIFSETIKQITGQKKRKVSGTVVKTEWPQYDSDVNDLPKIRFCFQHFNNGVSWEDIGVYEHMLSLIEKKGQLTGVKVWMI